MALRFAVVGVAIAFHLLPSQCRIVPADPTANALVALSAVIPNRFRVVPLGCALHVPDAPLVEWRIVPPSPTSQTSVSGLIPVPTEAPEWRSTLTPVKSELQVVPLKWAPVPA